MSTDVDQRTTADPSGDLVVVPLRHYGRLAFGVAVAAFTAVVVYALATNPNIDWSLIAGYLTNSQILGGLLVTLEMTVCAMAISLLIAVVIATMRLSESRLLRVFAWLYIFVFRGVPLIVLLIIIGNAGLFVRTVRVPLPFGSGPLVWDIQSTLTPFISSVIALSLVGSAYMSEIVRGGILSVNAGQHLAAKALGMNWFASLRFILLPQALRAIVPPLGNELINTMKATSLVSVIAGGDLLTVVQSIAGINYRVIDMLIVATIWYLIAISVLSAFQYFIERRVSAY